MPSKQTKCTRWGHGSTLLVASVALLAAACSDDRGSSHPLPPGTTSSGTTTTGVAGGGGEGASGTGGSGGVGATGSDAPLGALPIQGVADTACVAKGGTEVEVYAAAGAPPRFNRLVTVGARRAAQEASIGGFVVMDTDGVNASADLIFASVLHNQIASEGTTLGVVTVEETLLFQRFDDQGASVSALLDVSTDAPAKVAIAANGGSSLLAWQFEQTVHARVVSSNGSFAGPTVALGAGADDLAIVAAPAPGGFAVAWSGDVGADDYRSYFVHTGMDGSAGSPVEVTHGAEPHEVARLVQIPTGHVLLVNGGPPTWATYVVLFDDQGAIAGPAYQLEGAFVGRDVAALGAEIGVVAGRATDETEFRPFDGTMAPLGPWVCLDGPTSTGEPAAIDADPNGYAVLYRSTSGGTQLARFDRLGTGSP